MGNTEPHAHEAGVFPPVRAELPVYVLWLAPAILGAVMNWAWWVALLLLVPGCLLWLRVVRTATAARDPGMPRHLTWIEEIPFTIATAVVGVVLFKLGPGRYLVLAFVTAWIAVLVPARRMIWRRVDREERQLLLDLDAEGVGAASPRQPVDA